VADASLFPDALQINPYLTIMALADRVAEGVLRDVQSGGLTRNEDPQITQMRQI
jgi:choline dehydrogenase-like flavoprotein